MHEGVAILNYHVPKAFLHDNGKLTGMTFEKVAASKDDKGRRVLDPDRRAGRAHRLRRCADRGRTGERLSLDRMRIPASSSAATACRSSIPSPFNRACLRVLRRRFRVRAEEHHHRGRARPRGGDLDRRLLPRRGPASASAADDQSRSARRWAFTNGPMTTRSRSTAVSRCRRQRHAIALKNIRDGSRTRLRPRARVAEAQRCLNCDVQTVFSEPACIECDACVDICPIDCISFVANASRGASLRQSLNAPANDLSQAIYVSQPVKTGRVMVKDEDLCLHCGLCAERCPTGAWDMQKFTIHDGTSGSGMPIQAVNDFVIRFANVNGSGSASANLLFARSILRMGVPIAPRNIFPSNIQGLPTWYEVRVSEARLARRARPDRRHGRDEPADLRQGRRVDRAGRLPLLRFVATDLAASRLRNDIVMLGMPLTEICTARICRSEAASAVQEHRLCRRARGAVGY